MSFFMQLQTSDSFGTDQRPWLESILEIDVTVSDGYTVSYNHEKQQRLLQRHFSYY